MTVEKRPYRKTRRAELEQATRRRITESAVALHGTLGPSRTSLSAIAEHAGVRRSTLYRHFADEAAVFEACSAHWLADNPLPDPSAWGRIADPGERLRAALGELYAYYERTEGMLANLYRDEHLPVVDRVFEGFRGYLRAAQDALAAGPGADSTAARAAVGHAIAFATWRSLVREHGLSRAEAVELMCATAAAARAC